MEILFVDLMHAHGEFDAFNGKSFEQTFNLFEEDEAKPFVIPQYGGWSSESDTDSVKSKPSDIGRQYPPRPEEADG